MFTRLWKNVKFAWEYFLQAKHHLSPFPDFGYAPVDDTLMNYLAGMYEGHGARAFRFGNWVIVDDGKLLTRAACCDVKSKGDNLIVQIDFVTMHAGRHIVESFAGIGSDKLSALKDACASFQDSTFHALLNALLAHPCTHCDVESWGIRGVPRKVTLGLLRVRGNLPMENWPQTFDALRALIQEQEIPPGLHWLRCYYSHLPGNEPTVEALLDNEPLEALYLGCASLPWPSSDQFYSARIFMVLQDQS
jgi:hypothetical protein